MSKYVEKNLIKNEEIIIKAKFSKIIITFKMIGGILFFWLLFIPLVKAIYFAFNLNSSELAITNKRVIAKKGVFNTKVFDAQLDKIQNITISQNFWGKVFKYSTIDINTASEEENAFRFEYVKDADKFKSYINEQIDINQKEQLNAQLVKIAAKMIKEEKMS